MISKLRALPAPIVLTYAAAALSGVLMAMAFAPFDMADLGWCALVPLIIACSYVEPRQAIRMGWLTGTLYWLVTIFFLTRVTVVGWILLCFYCGLFVIPVAWSAAWWLKRFGVGNFFANAGFMIMITAMWVGFEYGRCTWFTGFPWNPLGASQYANLAFIQHASWGGVYVLSALLVWGNAAIALTMLRYLHKQARFGRRPHAELMLGMTVIIIAFVMGSRMMQQVDSGGDVVRIALIQPSIAQEDKWTDEKVEMIYDQLWRLTSSAIPLTNPDLVVWPETALPDDVRTSQRSYDLVDKLCRLGAPILVGSMDTAFIANQRPKFFNSSFLFNTNGVITGVYEKRHLVLLGEYVPFHEHIRFLTAMTPIMESFTSGSTSTVFQLPDRNIAFSSLICFEDTLGYLGRASVRNGARLLINQTNDAWFDPWWASKQHMALSVFRAVENRVPVVRSANTGFTCAIDARGMIRESLASEHTRHDGPGFLLASVVVPTHHAFTFYTRHGDVFALTCLAIALLSLATMAWSHRIDRQRRGFESGLPVR